MIPRTKGWRGNPSPRRKWGINTTLSPGAEVGTLVRVGAIQTFFNPILRRHLEPSPSEWVIGGPSHTTQKPSGIGSLDAYSCPYITVSDISNIPNTSSLLLVCACIVNAVGVLWFYLKPGRFQAREFSRHVPNWLYVYDAWHITNSS